MVSLLHSVCGSSLSSHCLQRTVGKKNTSTRSGSCTLKLRNWDKHRGKATVGTFLFILPRQRMNDEPIKLGKWESHASDVRPSEIMCQRCWNS